MNNLPRDKQQLIRHILTRDLDALTQEVEATPPTTSCGRAFPASPTSLGTLAFTSCGNLRHFIGHEIGGDGYERDRDAEFSRNPFQKRNFWLKPKRPKRWSTTS